MTFDNLIVALSHVARDEWVTSELEEEASHWLPLLQISASNLWLGLDDDGAWALGRIGGRVISSVSANLPQPWMTMLDMSEEELRERLRVAAERFQLPNDVLQNAIPVDDVLVMAIEDRFAIDMPDEDVAQLRTVRQLIEYVELAVAMRQPGKPPAVAATVAPNNR